VKAVRLTDMELLMLKQCLAAVAKSNPELYPTAELLMSAVLRAEQDDE
jgi:hypothetical protein